MSPREQVLADEFWRVAEQFKQEAERLGNRDIRNYYWYHTIELPDGLITPGQYDFRQTLAAFPFPRDMSGMRVLDVGSATGFFAFEFARRGAHVISVELPSLYALDRFPGQDIEQILESIRRMMGPRSAVEPGGGPRYTADEMYFYLLEGPFEFCRKQLGLTIERCYSTVYELTEAKIGGRVDLAFMGDILLHTLNPLQALAAVAPFARTLVLSQMVPEESGDKPAMAYVGGDSLESDDVSWWLPNKACLIALLKKLGFRRVRDVGEHTGMMRPSGYVYKRPILLAEK
jgi:tRNA (mo5U34)-methyltransferase